MKRIAKQAIALALASAFTFAAAPAIMAQTSAMETMATTNITAAARERQYNELKAELERIAAEQAARRAEITQQIQEQSPSLSAELLAAEVDQRLNAELQAATEERLSRTVNTEQGQSFIALPDEFGKAVRGCTTDGYIYRMEYNVTIDFEELAGVPAPETSTQDMSLFYRIVKMDPEARLGVSGTDAFMVALRAMTDGVHSSMQTQAGRLIDEASADLIRSDLFGDLLFSTTSEITDQIKQRYGVSLVIDTEAPVEQGGRCAAAPEEIAPEEVTPAPAPAPIPSTGPH